MSRRKRPSPRERVTAHLEALGYTVRTLDVPNNGRRHFETDLCMFEFFGSRDGSPVVLQCFDTMTKCAQRGVEVSRDGFGDQVLRAKLTPEEQASAAANEARRRAENITLDDDERNDPP